MKKSLKKDDSKPSSPSKKIAVRIIAQKMELQNADGFFIEKLRNDIIKNPWPELLEMAKKDKDCRILQIIEIDETEDTEV